MFDRLKVMIRRLSPLQASERKKSADFGNVLVLTRTGPAGLMDPPATGGDADMKRIATRGRKSLLGILALLILIILAVPTSGALAGSDATTKSFNYAGRRITTFM